METVSDFIFLSSKINADSDCSHKIKRCLLLGRKVMIDLDSILKIRDITLPTKVLILKAMVFSVMYGCESWIIKKAECQRIDSFKLWCWRRLLRVFWTTGRSNQSILKEINPEYSLEGLMLKLQLRWPSDLKSWLIGKDPDADRDWGQEKGATEDEMVGWYHWLNGHEFEQILGDAGRTGNLSMFQSMELQRVGHDWATKQQKISCFKIMTVIPCAVQCSLGVLLLLNPIEDFTS